ncbi:MAG TPA: NAD(P)-dependent alcohol dehydrogenase [Lacibacter sp.]|nr:NAD(P)-dependent alcohol dehydrogenase [Lacibacter sp.]HMO88465.1 NAD(P)-dependent alcohol dehydrogenase [Lacibacter sp.]HMP87550.1 NAD(P)-dependent alcohol dehydrogenase [Lacibacter sp.]
MHASLMKAVICRAYGPPDVLQLIQLPVPQPRDHELLVRVRASSVNSGDVRIRSLGVPPLARPFMRLALGWSRPRQPIPGIVFAGTVEQTGAKVTQFRPGDQVYGLRGIRMGAYADYLCVAQKSMVARMPANATFGEAAALPFGGHTALHFLQKASLPARPNARVLVYGATGAVGTAALQLARHWGARVTAVCRAAGRDLVTRLGAADTIAYDQEDFTQTPGRFDLIFDAVGKTSRRQCAHLLAAGGRWCTVGGLEVANEKKEQLELLRDLYEQGHYQAVIDRVYPLEEIVEAHRYVDTGRKQGNVVVEL